MSFYEEVNAFLSRRPLVQRYAGGSRVVITPDRLPIAPLYALRDRDRDPSGDLVRSWIAIENVLSWRTAYVTTVTPTGQVVLNNGRRFSREGRAMGQGKHNKNSRIHPAYASYVALVEQARVLQAEITEAKERDEEGRALAAEIRKRAAEPGSGPLLAAVRAVLSGECADIDRASFVELHEHLAIVVGYLEEEASQGDGVAERHWDGYQAAKALLIRTAPLVERCASAEIAAIEEVMP